MTEEVSADLWRPGNPPVGVPIATGRAGSEALEPDELGVPERVHPHRRHRRVASSPVDAPIPLLNASSVAIGSTICVQPGTSDTTGWP